MMVSQIVAWQEFELNNC